MDIAVVSLVVFLAGSLIIATVAMVIRDLFFANQGAAPGKPRRGKWFGSASSIRRQSTVADEVPATSVTGRLDQAFERLVLESGANTSTFAAMLMLLTSGIALGGGLYVYKDDAGGAFLGFTLGIGAGLGYLVLMRARRMRDFQEHLPDVLDLMARAVRAGESLDQAIELVGKETPGTVGQEFLLCSQQLTMGMSLASVMRSLMRRVRSIDVRILASTLMVHRQTGGNLALTLERMSGVIRDRLNYRRQMRASTGAGRVSTMLIAAAGPVMFLGMFFWQFDHLRIMLDQQIGQVMLGLAVVLEVIGIAWIGAMLQSDY